MTTDPSYGRPIPQKSTRDTENLDRIAKAQGVIAGLLGLVALLLVAGLVLGIVGYNLIADRLDNIETSTAHTAAVVAP